MTTSLDYLRKNQQAKERLAIILGIPKKYIQQYIYELIDLAKEGDGAITIDALLKTTSTSSSLASASVNLGISDESKKTQAQEILDELTFLIDKDGKVYQINKA